MGKRAGLTGCILAAVCCCSVAEADSLCDRDLIAVGGTTGYQARDGLVCEGIYVSRVGAPPVELVSLTRGSSLAREPLTVDLSVTVPPGRHFVHVRATGIPSALYYRLDAILRPQQTLHWQARRVLGAAGIPLADVGLFAFFEDETGTPIYLPVMVGGAQRDDSNRVEAELRTADLVEDLRWRFVSDSTTGGQSWTDIDAADDRLVVPLSSGPGSLEISWSDPQTGKPRQALFRIGV